MKTKNLAMIFKMQACSPYPLTWPSSCGRLLQTLGELPPAVVGEPSSHGYAMTTGLLLPTPLPWASPQLGFQTLLGHSLPLFDTEQRSGQSNVFLISMFCLDFSFPDFLSSDSLSKRNLGRP